jgi:plastocyanin
MRLRHLRGPAAGVAALLVTACGDGGSPGTEPPPSSNVSVTVRNNAFDPATARVLVNGTVTWTWAAGAVDHNVSFTGGPMPLPANSSNRMTGTHSVTFTEPGTYNYTCTLHPGMDGSVVVTP